MSSIIDSKISHRFFSKPLFFILLSAFFVFTLSFIWLNSENSSAFRTDIKHLILNELIYVNPPPSSAKLDAIYVLGGNQRSLDLKFKTAADLYHKRIVNKIIILCRPGITDYSRMLGRNLTNNEWAVLKLEQLDIPKKNIEFARVNEGFFGTFSEAKDISRLINNRHYKHIVLITSASHTQRVKISFEKFLGNQNISLFVQGSGETSSLHGLIIEFIKLKIYEYFLLSYT